MLWFKVDWIATRTARRNGTFLSKESKITMPREVGQPGEPGYHSGPHEKLAGADMRRRYEEILKRDGRSCAGCGAVIAEDDYYTRLEMDHIVSRGQGGCDDACNLRMMCANLSGTGCHQLRHTQRRKDAQWNKGPIPVHD